MKNEDLEVTAAIGQTLLQIQMTERVLGFLYRTAFRGETTATMEEFEGEKDFVWGATLGRLIKKLKERVELDSEFEKYLGQFKDDRDFFVHHLFDLVSTNEREEDKHQKILDRCEQLRAAITRLFPLFVAVLIKWYKSLKPNEPMDEETKLFIEKAGNWPKAIDQLFRVRGS